MDDEVFEVGQWIEVTKYVHPSTHEYFKLGELHCIFGIEMDSSGNQSILFLEKYGEKYTNEVLFPSEVSRTFQAMVHEASLKGDKELGDTENGSA